MQRRPQQQRQQLQQLQLYCYSDSRLRAASLIGNSNEFSVPRSGAPKMFLSFPFVCISISYNVSIHRKQNDLNKNSITPKVDYFIAIFSLYDSINRIILNSTQCCFICLFRYSFSIFMGFFSIRVVEILIYINHMLGNIALPQIIAFPFDIKQSLFITDTLYARIIQFSGAREWTQISKQMQLFPYTHSIDVTSCQVYLNCIHAFRTHSYLWYQWNCTINFWFEQYLELWADVISFFSGRFNLYTISIHKTWSNERTSWSNKQKTSK